LRYGFLSDFDSPDRDDTADLDAMLKYHINIVQFYDWAYRHHQFLSPDQIYTDMMGKRIDFAAVRAKIQGCHERGMRTLGYGAVYAAGREYHAAHHEEGLYTSAGEPLLFIDRFYIMNVAAGNGWRTHIIEEYCKAMQAGFDGIHMDTYGFPKTAFDASGRLVRLDREYPSLIADTRAATGAIKQKAAHNVALIFNNVGNWPTADTARAPQDAVYIEVWPPNTDYAHIRQIILDAQAACNYHKTIIIAAYVAPFRTEAEGSALMSALLLFGVIVSHGATQLLLGENNAALTQGYYSDYTKLSPSTVSCLRKYADFSVRYAAVFYDSLLRDVSMTHICADNTEYRCHAPNWNVIPETGKLWLTIREKDSAKMINILNLAGCNDTCWNSGKCESPVYREIPFSVQTDFGIKGIWWASPDRAGGTMIALSWKSRKTDRGYCVDFTVPEAGVWTLVYLECCTEPER
jgi:dextranase